MREEGPLQRQATRLAPFRERLLRRVTPATRGATLDLACGPATITAELAARVKGPVIAADADASALRRVGPPARAVRACAEELPFRGGAFDLVVTQAAWLWFSDPEAAAREVRRVLAPGGVLVAVGEPDFGGAISEPPAASLAPAWISALRRLGADPFRARRVPGLLRRAGFPRVEAEVFGPLETPDGLAALREEEAGLLRGLDLEPPEESEAVRALAIPAELSFVPVLGVLAWA